MSRISVKIALLALMPSVVLATGPADYVYLPGVTYGEHEIDFKMGLGRTRGESRLGVASIGYGFGVTQRWFTEFYTKYERPGGEATRFDAWEWENKFQLTETGEYPVDAGMLVELEHPRDRSEGNELRIGPLFQTEMGRTQLNGNIFFARNYSAAISQAMQLWYQWQIKYRWQPRLEFGMQGFGEMGPWNHWVPSEQRTHRVGPALFGKVSLGDNSAIRYNTAWLIGASSATPGHTVRMQAEYEF